MRESEKNQISFLSEMDKVALKRYNLSEMLNDQRFINSIARVIQDLQDFYGTGLSLSQAITLISTVLDYVPKIAQLSITEGKDDFERAKRVLSLAIMDYFRKADYLEKAPENLTYERNVVKQKEKRTEINQKIFIVGEMNSSVVQDLSKMLSEFGLQPINLHEEPDIGRTIVEKFEKFSNVGMAFVILDTSNPFSPLEGCRANQNVLVELGYFVGLIGRKRVLCLVREGIVLPSDIAGITYITFRESLNEIRQTIMSELMSIGYSFENALPNLWNPLPKVDFTVSQRLRRILHFPQVGWEAYNDSPYQLRVRIEVHPILGNGDLHPLPDNNINGNSVYPVEPNSYVFANGCFTLPEICATSNDELILEIRATVEDTNDPKKGKYKLIPRRWKYIRESGTWSYYPQELMPG